MKLPESEDDEEDYSLEVVLFWRSRLERFSLPPLWRMRVGKYLHLMPSS
jgi:hypothetical protein